MPIGRTLISIMAAKTTPYTIKAATLHHRGPGQAPSPQQQPNHQCTVNTV